MNIAVTASASYQSIVRASAPTFTAPDGYQFQYAGNGNHGMFVLVEMLALLTV